MSAALPAIRTLADIEEIERIPLEQRIWSWNLNDSLFAGLATGIVCVVNWMLKPEHLVELIRSARTRVLVVLGPTPGYHIWENIQSIRERLPETTRIVSVQALGGVKLPESDFDELCAAQPGGRLLFERNVVAD